MCVIAVGDPQDERVLLRGRKVFNPRDQLRLGPFGGVLLLACLGGDREEILVEAEEVGETA